MNAKSATEAVDPSLVCPTRSGPLDPHAIVRTAAFVPFIYDAQL